MRLLILGASGQLGSSVLGLNLDGYEVDFPSREILDVTNYESTRDYLSNTRPDFVINSTAWTDVPGAENHVQEAFALNCDAVGNLANICKDLNSTLVHVSSDYVFDGLKASPYSEVDSTSPLNVYGKSKLAGEIKILESGLQMFYIVRTSWLYSRFGKNFVKTIASKSIRNETVSINEDQFGSPTFAGDLAQGILALLESKAKPGIYNYSNSGVTNWYEFGKSIYELTGADHSLVSPRKTEIGELQRPTYSPLNLNKWDESGLPQMRTWKEALKSELPDIIKEFQGKDN